MNTTVVGATPRRKIFEIFSDPYDPEKSFWIHTEIGRNIKESFIEADERLAEGKLKLAKKPLDRIVAQLPAGARDAYLRRLTYNYRYLRSYEPFVRTYNVPADLKNQFIAADKKQALHNNVALPPALNELMQRTRSQTRELYGIDVLRSEVSVRYANDRLASPFRCDEENDVDARLLSAVHFDEKKGLTSIVYLSDVDERSGCFSYLEDSHLLRQSLTIRTFHETIANDLRIATAEEAKQHGIPESLFGTLDYGQNLPAAKREVAKKYLFKHTGPAGTSISFTGNTLLHGGGWPINGERVAMFLAHIGLIGHRAQYLIPYFLHFKLAS